MERKTVLVMHDIRSAHNVGSMFRTADGLGVTRIYLSGYSQVPAIEGQRFLTDAEKALRKTALGAEYAVPWERAGSLPDLLAALRENGYSVVSLECGTGGTDIRRYRPVGDIALIVGNETEGISDDILSGSDAVLEIPMRGVKESLNVSVATGIALFRLNGTIEERHPFPEACL